MKRRPAFAGRDQELSSFGMILGRLCDTAGALGAALVDGEGESVDYAGAAEPYELKVMAAEWCIVLDRIRSCRFEPWRRTHQVVVRAAHGSYALFGLSDGYALVVRLLPYAFRLSKRAISEAIHDLCEEAGLQVPDSLQGERWARVDVREASAEGRRPQALWVDGSWCEIEVLGLYAGRDLHPKEIGYRARLASGAEVTLIRERLGTWYADGRLSG